MIKLHIVPQPGQFPQRGGVREHLLQIYNAAANHPSIQLVSNEAEADIVHVESAYKANGRPSCYTCHGGFLSSDGRYDPLQVVLANLRDAKVIVSVAQWIVDNYFQQYAHKTLVIPNGVNLADWENVPASGLEPGYVLYAKEIEYYIKDFVWAVLACPTLRFVTTVWPKNLKTPDNLTVIGLQSHDAMRSYVKDAGCLLLTGPEVCPTMLLEAWACKVPVVANYAGGAKELMYRAGGLLYDGTEDLATQLWNCKRNGLAMGVAGRELVEQKYQWKDQFEKYVWVYENLLEGTQEQLFK